MDMKELLENTRKVVAGDMGVPTILPCPKCSGQLPFFSSVEICPYCGTDLTIQESADSGYVTK